MAVHDIDVLVWLTKAENPEYIFVATHACDPVLAKAGVADSMTAIIKYT
jgi:predicted dehydrogenase